MHRTDGAEKLACLPAIDLMKPAFFCVCSVAGGSEGNWVERLADCPCYWATTRREVTQSRAFHYLGAFRVGIWRAFAPQTPCRDFTELTGDKLVCLCRMGRDVLRLLLTRHCVRDMTRSSYSDAW